MLSIRTDLSSLIAQNSLTQSTNKLNQAIERMTTGTKINHAKDNAANYSISTNMTTKMGAYMIAQDNVSIGMELVGTAESIISQMQDHAVRLRELSTQAINGTYGAQSLNAIQSEANARIAEITRLYLSSEYNGISLFDRQAFVIPDNLVKAGESGFIDETAVDIKPEYDGFIANPYTYDDVTVNAMDSVTTFTNGSNGTYKITSDTDLAYLAEIVNDKGWDTSNATFVLANDIDLASWCANNGNWVPIGNGNAFKGVFDGNGHVIKNLKIDNPTADRQGLFGYVGDYTYNSTIKNLGIEDSLIISGGYSGALLGHGNSAANYIDNCYSEANIKGSGDYIGGLVGSANSNSITNSYATGTVSGTNSVGGLVGASAGSTSNSYATGTVSGAGDYVGGLTGKSFSSSIINSYATGTVSGAGDYVGGLVGQSSSSITNSYSTGGVSGNEFVGGLIGQVDRTSGTASISSSYSLGEVTGTAKSGTLIGGVVNTYNGTSFGTVNILDCYTLDSGMDLLGGCYSSQAGNPENTNGYDAMLAGISLVPKIDVHTSLQVGIMGDANSQISFNTNFKYDLSALSDIGSGSALNAIDDFISTLSTKEVELGSVSNRLESVLDEITIQYENLVSSRSTIRDADMAELSSTYIQQQILQEASSTLLATTKNIQYQNVLGLLQGLRG